MYSHVFISPTSKQFNISSLQLNTYLILLLRREWAFPVSEKKWKPPFALFGAFLGFVQSSTIFCLGLLAHLGNAHLGKDPSWRICNSSCTVVCALITATPSTVLSLSYMVINVMLCYGLIKKKLNVIYVWQIVNVISILALVFAHGYVSSLLISDVF